MDLPLILLMICNTCHNCPWSWMKTSQWATLDRRFQWFDWSCKRQHWQDGPNYRAHIMCDDEFYGRHDGNDILFLQQLTRRNDAQGGLPRRLTKNNGQAWKRRGGPSPASIFYRCNSLNKTAAAKRVECVGLVQNYTCTYLLTKI